MNSSLVVERTEHRKISVALLTEDEKYLNFKYGSVERAEERLQELEHLLNYGNTDSLNNR